MRDYIPDLIFLAETISDHSHMEWIRVQLGFAGKLVVHWNGNNGGICLFWCQGGRSSFFFFFFSNYPIDVGLCSHNGKMWRFTGFYGHPDANQRIHTWNLLRRLN
ncbi:hypothetical protein ACOSQ4_002083 [Xanthoceras sorbifolium]